MELGDDVDVDAGAGGDATGDDDVDFVNDAGDVDVVDDAGDDDVEIDIEVDVDNADVGAVADVTVDAVVGVDDCFPLGEQPAAQTTRAVAQILTALRLSVIPQV